MDHENLVCPVEIIAKRGAQSLRLKMRNIELNLKGAKINKVWFENSAKRVGK